MVLIVSKVVVVEGSDEPKAAHAPGVKCERCWTWKETVGSHKEHPTLCARCAAVVTS